MMKTLRLCLVFYVICGVYCSVPALAQTPDTTSAWRYLPLDIGNVWEYERSEQQCYFDMPCDPVEFLGYMRRSVAGDSVAGDERYAVVVEELFTPEGQLFRTSRNLVRFDTLHARLYARTDSGDEEPWPAFFGCALDEPFEADVECETDDYVHTAGGYEVEVQIEDETVTTTAKEYNGYLGYNMFAADLGEVYNAVGKFVTDRRALIYARIGDLEYGAEQFPVAAEASAPEEGALALLVYPNPAHGAATVCFALDRPQRVTLAVFDVLGRHVIAAELGPQPAGDTTHRLELAALPVGVYVVRLTGDAGAWATARIVRH